MQGMSEPEVTRPKRIIYVEDDSLMGELVKDLLTQAGYLIGVIEHRTLAHETIAFKKPDLVILDRSLLGMQGLEILRRLRTTPDTYLIPVLMLTANGGGNMIDEGLGAGANEYLDKPFDPDELVQRVAAILKDSLYNHRTHRLN